MYNIPADTVLYILEKNYNAFTCMQSITILLQFFSLCISISLIITYITNVYIMYYYQ